MLTGESSCLKRLAWSILEKDSAITLAGDDHFDSKICVLGELVNHHVREEEKEIFEALRDSNIDLEALGEKFNKRKAELAKGPIPKTKRLVASSKGSPKRK